MVLRCENGECTHDIPIGSLFPVLRMLWVTNSKHCVSNQCLLLLCCQDDSIHIYHAELQGPIVCLRFFTVNIQFLTHVYSQVIWLQTCLVKECAHSSDRVDHI